MRCKNCEFCVERQYEGKTIDYKCKYQGWFSVNPDDFCHFEPKPKMAEYDLWEDGTLMISLDDYDKVREVIVHKGCLGSRFVADQDTEPLHAQWNLFDWDQEGNEVVAIFECSNCGREQSCITDFCPDCGAKMDL